MDICCISETKLYETSRVQLTAPAVSAHFWLRCSGDASAVATGQAGVGIVLSSTAEASLLEWIPVNSRLCAVRLQCTAKVNASRNKKRCLFVISAYAPTNVSDDAVKDEFLLQLRSLLRRTTSTDIVIVAWDMNAQVGQWDNGDL